MTNTTELIEAVADLLSVMDYGDEDLDFQDDEAVSYRQDKDGNRSDDPMTFGHIRRVRAALASTQPTNNQDPTVRERVARAICEAEGFDPDEPEEIHDEVGDETHQPFWKNYSKQARAALSATPVERWRPIETAPKDGTPVLGYRPFDGNWKENQDSVVEVRWRTDSFGWTGFMGIRGQRYAVTHWMPLPPAPDGGE